MSYVHSTHSERKSTLLAIDPGAKPGWAHFLGGDLVGCGTGRPVLPPFSTLDQIVCELPEVYPRSKSRPNDLIKLAFTAGESCGRISAVYDWPAVRLVRPKQWKGSVSKIVVWQRILRKLNEKELAMYYKVKDGADRDCLEAIGLGLFLLGRSGRAAT